VFWEVEMALGGCPVCEKKGGKMAELKPTTFTVVDMELTLRDWFAGQALQALITMADIEIENEHIAETAYQIADALLAAREVKHG
jgi:hypothetical protein